MSGVFISYRHGDSWDESHRLYKHLAEALGDEKLFIDVVKIEPGQDFSQVIDEKVGFCDVLLAIIGNDWLSISDKQQCRRLDDPKDWVRLEISSALERGIPVIPVLVDGAVLPEANQLPDNLARLAMLQAQKINNEQYDEDAGCLLAVLKKFVRSANFITIWVSLLIRGHKAIDPLDLQRPETLWQALRFLAYMILIVDILHIPFLAGKITGTVTTDLLFTAFLIDNYIEWLAAGVILHLLMRAFGGKATFQKSITAYCFLSAYLPLFSLSMVPVWSLHQIVFKDAADLSYAFADTVQILHEFVQQLGPLGIAKIIASFVLSTFILVLMLRTIFIAFRTLHRLHFGRTVIAFGFSMTTYLAFIAFFYAPLISIVLKLWE